MKEDIEIIDCHMDLTYGLKNNPRNFYERSEIGDFDLPRLREGKVSAAFFAIYPATNYYYLMAGVDTWFNVVENPKNQLMLIKDVDDLENAKKNKKIGAILHIEGAGAIDTQFSILRNLHRLGLRSIGITWSDSNIYGTGVATDINRGLTDEGKSLVKEMEKLGIIVDASHLNETSFWDLVDTINKPFIASHSNARLICNTERNLNDEQMKALADCKGVVGITFCNTFLQENNPTPENITFEQIKEHIDHMVEITGIDFIALGSDFDGAKTPQIIKDVSHYPKLINFLLENGYSKQDVKKIAHKNIQRIFNSVWR
ncbi:MAG: membrane dipeptidase [Candidatus Lokiarchaeota archaeon]|nr:membrane dipeptidase [Candidatus Lokiarchaeota archaeon]